MQHSRYDFGFRSTQIQIYGPAGQLVEHGDPFGRTRIVVLLGDAGDVRQVAMRHPAIADEKHGLGFLSLERGHIHHLYPGIMNCQYCPGINATGCLTQWLLR